MQMTGEQYIAAPRQKVWEALNNPDVLRDSIPGCQSLSKEADDRFNATVEVKVGPIGARFKGAVTLSDLNPANGYSLHLEGNGGIAGTAKGSARVKLADQQGGTLVTYDVDAQVGGRMAQLGGPIIDATAKQLAGKFFGRFGDIVSGVTVPAAEAAPTVALAAPAVAGTGKLSWAWVVALLVATVGGFLLGRSPELLSAESSGWAGLALGLLLILIAVSAFEYGRRTAAPVVMLDPTLLRRLLDAPPK